MPDGLKISELVPAILFRPDAIAPIVQDGGNYSVTRDIFLTCADGETVQLAGADAAMGVDAYGNLIANTGAGRAIVFQTDGGQCFQASASAGTVVLASGGGRLSMYESAGDGFYIDPSAGVTVQSVAGDLLTITDTNSSIKFDGVSGFQIESLGGTVFVTDSSYGVDFAAPPGLGMYFTVGGADIIQIANDGTAAMVPPAAKTFTLGDTSTAFILVSNNAPVYGKSFQFGVVTGGTWKFTYNNQNVMALANSGSLQFTSRGTTDFTLTSTAQNISLTASAGTVKLATSTPVQALVWLNGLVAGNWTLPVPADHVAAINRLAAAVAGLLGGTIP